MAFVVVLLLVSLVLFVAVLLLRPVKAHLLYPLLFLAFRWAKAMLGSVAFVAVVGQVALEHPVASSVFLVATLSKDLVVDFSFAAVGVVAFVVYSLVPMGL